MTAPILSPPLRVWDNAAVLLHTGKRKGARVVTTSALLLELSLRGLADQRNSGDRLLRGGARRNRQPRTRTIIAAVSPFDFQCQSFSG
jgi:hypothetical protein